MDASLIFVLVGMPTNGEIVLSATSCITVVFTFLCYHWAYNYFSLKKLAGYIESQGRESKENIKMPVKLRYRILDLDGVVLRQTGLLEILSKIQIISAKDLGPRLRVKCNFVDWFKLENRITELTGSATDDEILTECNTSLITFYGSNDFHHVTLALIRRFRTPFNFVILDNHPDWIQWYPGLHCGCWMSHVAHLPTCNQVFHLGGSSSEFTAPETSYLMPWRLLKNKIWVFPSTSKFVGGVWDEIEQNTLRGKWYVLLTKERLKSLLAPYLESLREYPIYISVDKDVMTREYAIQNWNSGELLIDEVLIIIEVFIELSGCRLLGLDVTGEFSSVDRGFFQRLMNRFGRDDTLSQDAAFQELSDIINQKANIQIINRVRTVLGGMNNESGSFGPMQMEKEDDHAESHWDGNTSETRAEMTENIEESEDDETQDVPESRIGIAGTRDQECTDTEESEDDVQSDTLELTLDIGNDVDQQNVKSENNTNNEVRNASNPVIDSAGDSTGQENANVQ